MSKIVRKKRVLNFPAVQVWRALTDPHLTKHFMFGSEVISDFKVGSEIKYIGHEDGEEIVYVKGEVLEVDPEKLLKYTVFSPGSGYEDSPENYLELTYKLTEEKDITTLEVLQGDFEKVEDGEARYEKTQHMWDEALDQLEEFLDSDDEGEEINICV
jgi:uncharacterized protein YndB with AHSA1/START domain